MQSKPVRKLTNRRMSAAERRRVLEGIARDVKAYPRDRIAAIKALEALDGADDQPVTEFGSLDELEPRRKAKTT